MAVYRADALRYVLEQHSLSVYAEDLENALILLANNESIYYDGRLVVETDAVPTVRRLFSQRVGWHFGLMRVYASRWRSLWRRSAAQARKPDDASPDSCSPAGIAGGQRR